MPAADKLIAGYQRFRKGYYHKHKELLLNLAQEGQSPKIAIVSCCDSRVEPSVILDTQPGDLFVIRNVANLVPPCEHSDHFHGTSSALEFAVTQLEVESIIVLGHTHCGGIKALMDNPPTAASSDSFIATWMSQLKAVRENVLAEAKAGKLPSDEQRYRACEQAGIAHSIANLMSFPWIASRVKAGKLKLHGWHYDLDNAELFAQEASGETFKKVS